MKGARQLISMLVIAAMLLGIATALQPSDAEAGLKQLLACGAGATAAAKWMCPFGPAWCAAGLLGGCVVAVVVMEYMEE